MPNNKKLLIITSLLAVVTFAGMTAMTPAHDDDDKFKNLKVLPKGIKEQQLDQVMHEWSHALNVHCNFCHARGADGKMDFASDEKPEKNMARDMYKMAASINKKYFKGVKDSTGMISGDIKCVTCHHGNPHPDEVKDAPGMSHDMQHGPGPAMPPPGSMPQPPATPPAGN